MEFLVFSSLSVRAFVHVEIGNSCPIGIQCNFYLPIGPLKLAVIWCLPPEHMERIWKPISDKRKPPHKILLLKPPHKIFCCWLILIYETKDHFLLQVSCGVEPTWRHTPLIGGRGMDGNVSSRITVGQKNQPYHTFISPDLMASNVNSIIVWDSIKWWM